MMILGVGKGPLADFVKRNFSEYIGSTIFPYPLFFDDKRELLEGRTREYIRKLWRNSTEIKIALYPDYADETLHLPKNITYIYPIHSISEYTTYYKIKEKYGNVFAGYASDPKYRSYTLETFLEKFKGEKLWYLGVSTKKELKEALLFRFDGMDITGFLIASKNQQRKDPRVLKRNLEELLRLISKPQGKQSSILEFLSVNWGVYGVRA